MEAGRFIFTVAETDRRIRLDRFLVASLPEDHSRTFIQKLIARGLVTEDGVVVESHHKVRPGASIEITIPEAVAYAAKPQRIALDIVYEDDELLVVNKRAGMVVHPAPGNWSGTLVNALLWHCKGSLSGIGGEMKPGIVHRIDKGTSGLLVVAKTDVAHRKLARQFKDKSSRRVYIAFVRGVIELDNGIIDLPIGRSKTDRMKMAVDKEGVRTAVTQYRVMKRFKQFTMVELTLGTGRTHQIRVHMAHIGYPVLGDETYGMKGEFERPALHAKTIGFVHPATGKYMEFTRDIPKDMKAIIAQGHL